MGKTPRRNMIGKKLGILELKGGMENQINVKRKEPGKLEVGNKTEGEEQNVWVFS